jgi:hypothetical protein
MRGAQREAYLTHVQGKKLTSYRACVTAIGASARPLKLQFCQPRFVQPGSRPSKRTMALVEDVPALCNACANLYFSTCVLQICHTMYCTACKFIAWSR